jgi:hypothetical protein
VILGCLSIAMRKKKKGIGGEKRERVKIFTVQLRDP